MSVHNTYPLSPSSPSHSNGAEYGSSPHSPPPSFERSSIRPLFPSLAAQSSSSLSTKQIDNALSNSKKEKVNVASQKIFSGRTAQKKRHAVTEPSEPQEKAVCKRKKKSPKGEREELSSLCKEIQNGKADNKKVNKLASKQLYQLITLKSGEEVSPLTEAVGNSKLFKKMLEKIPACDLEDLAQTQDTQRRNFFWILMERAHLLFYRRKIAASNFDNVIQSMEHFIDKLGVQRAEKMVCGKSTLGAPLFLEMFFSDNRNRPYDNMGENRKIRLAKCILTRLNPKVEDLLGGQNLSEIRTGLVSLKNSLLAHFSK